MPGYLSLNVQEPLPSREYVRIRTEGEQAGAAFAVHISLARQCRLLDAVFEDATLQSSETNAGDISVAIPDSKAEAVESVLAYLDLITIRIPSIISRPLKGPIEEVTQPWEVDFVRSHGLEGGDFSAHLKLLEILKVADFLVIDSLKDLCCAYIASTVLSCHSQEELLTKIGMSRPATEDELAEVYDMYPFLRGSE